MRRVMATAAAIAVGAMAAASSGLAVQAANPPAAMVDDFQLTDHTRLAHRLYYFGYAPAIVLMTRENGSAVSKAGAEGLQKLTESLNKEPAPAANAASR